MRVALADGSGAPRSLLPALGAAAARHGGVRLVLGWMPFAEPDLDPTPFADVRAVMSGWGLRSPIDAGSITAVPCRLSAVPSLLAGALRPDLLIASVVRRRGRLFLGAESSWMRGLIEAGVPTAAVVSTGATCADAGPPLPESAIAVLGDVDDTPREIPAAEPGPVDLEIAARVARLVPEGARVQVGPGRLGAAMLGALTRPVLVDSGLLPDAVVDLDRAGLLLGTPVATYLAGTAVLHDWADGRGVLHPIEVTHDLGRLSNGPPLIALNTAVEIDLDGQVNAEGTASSIVGGVGGHPDYSAAAARSRLGVSVVAIAAEHRGRPTLVRTLSRPVTTPAHDVDVVVTEHGLADLRGCGRVERRAALARLWAGEICEPPPERQVADQGRPAKRLQE